MKKMCLRLLRKTLPAHRWLLEQTMRAAVVGCAGALAAGSWESAMAIAAYFAVALTMGWWLAREAADTVAT